MATRHRNEDTTVKTSERSEPNVSFFVLKSLKQEGIDHIFLVPGAMIDPFLSNYSKAGIQAIVAAQEGGAAYMADGYGRTRQHFGVCMGIGGPGVTNMATALSAAYADRAPVLAIAGSISFGWEGKGTFQDSSSTGIDDIAVVRPMTTFAEVVPTANEVEASLKKALRAMRGLANRPVFLSLPLDLQQQTCKAEYTPLRLQEPARVVDIAAAQHVPEIMANATRIVIYVGNGAVWSHASAEIQHFAKQYEIPVVTTLRAKGAISEDDSMSFGVFGLGGSLQANKVITGDKLLGIPRAELLLVLGATLNENNTQGWRPDFPPEKALVRVDINPNNVASVEYDEHFVMADIRTFFEWLEGQKSRYHDALIASRAARHAFAETIRTTPYYETDADRKSNQVPMHPARVIAELRKVAPRDAVMVVDSGAHTFFAAHHWTSYAPNEFLLLSAMGPMGYGVAMGVGAKLARPAQTCVCVVGDGSLLMHGMEVHTAVRYDVPLVIVVINNSALGNVYLRARQESTEAMKLSIIPTRNWTDFARSLGADGVVVKHPDHLAAAFQHAFVQAAATSKPFLVDARCDRNCPTPNTQENM